MRTRGMVLAVVCAAFLARAAAAQDAALWQQYAEEAKQAYQKGDQVAAERLLQLSRQEAEKFGPEDPRVAVTLNNLATLYVKQGKFAAAEPLYQRALAILEKAHGPEHPRTALAVVGLADCYLAESKFPEAEPLYQRALTSFEKAFGPENLLVAATLERQAGLLRKTNRSAQAEPLEARARDIRAKRAAGDK